jgi:hypothetical protein
VEKAGKKVGKLLEGVADQDAASPLVQMDIEERLVFDYHGTGMTTGHTRCFTDGKKCIG